MTDIVPRVVKLIFLPLAIAFSPAHHSDLASRNYFIIVSQLAQLTISYIVSPQNQGGGTPIHSVLRAATAVKVKVNSQFEIFSTVIIIIIILLLCKPLKRV